MPTLDMPPFPTLTSGYCSWEGIFDLRTWIGFPMPRVGQATESSPLSSDGSIDLRVEWYGRDPVPPSCEQSAGFAYLLLHEELATDSVLTAIFQQYPRIREHTLNDYRHASIADLPEITHPDQLRPLLGVPTVHVLVASRDGLAYVGFEFEPVWENDHGLGVMTHRSHFVEIGPAETAFLRAS